MAATNFPIQIKLTPVEVPQFDGADVVIAADCTAYKYADFEKDFGGKPLLMGCGKLDDMDYSEKLSEIFAKNDIKHISYVRMETPCCMKLEHMLKEGIKKSGKDIPMSTTYVGMDNMLKDKPLMHHPGEHPAA